MTAPARDDIRELLVRSQVALHLLGTQFADFLGVSDRTLRRWVDRGVLLSPERLRKLVTALHPRDPGLAQRVAAYHGRVVADVLLQLPLEPDPVAEAKLRDALLAPAVEIAGVAPATMRQALLSALEGAQRLGLTVEAVCELLAPDEG
jgi:hypothetical protein